MLENAQFDFLTVEWHLQNSFYMYLPYKLFKSQMNTNIQVNMI